MILFWSFLFSWYLYLILGTIPRCRRGADCYSARSSRGGLHARNELSILQMKISSRKYKFDVNCIFLELANFTLSQMFEFLFSSTTCSHVAHVHTLTDWQIWPSWTSRHPMRTLHRINNGRQVRFATDFKQNIIAKASAKKSARKIAQ